MKDQIVHTITDEFSSIPMSGTLIRQCVIPIFGKRGDDFVPLGSSFFISPGGLLMTAKHVVQEAHGYRSRRLNENGEYYDHWEIYALYQSDEVNKDQEGTYIGGFLQIGHVWMNETFDICIFSVALFKNGERLSFPSFRLSPSLPREGENVLGIGYYGSSETSRESSEAITINYSQESAFTRGKVLEVHPLKRDAGMLNFPCFHTDARFEGGMSGGPILNERGFVFGVICSSMPPVEEDPKYISYGALIWPVLMIEVEVLNENGKAEKITLYDLAQKGVIKTDESINNINIGPNIDGKIQISLKRLREQ